MNEYLNGQRINLPEIPSDADKAYACWKNSEIVTFHSSIFQNHIKDSPSVNSSEASPEHTIVIEADIRRPLKGGKPKTIFRREPFTSKSYK